MAAEGGADGPMNQSREAHLAAWPLHLPSRRVVELRLAYAICAMAPGRSQGANYGIVQKAASRSAIPPACLWPRMLDA
jgi:hypothetical protein